MSDLKFEVGDQVKVIGAEEDNCLGEVSVIFDVNSDPDVLYKYKMLAGGEERWFRESDLELVRDADDIYKKFLELSGFSAGGTPVTLSQPQQEVIENTSVKPSAKQYNPLEVQEGGGHYKGKGIQPLEYANANDLNPQKFNIVKYITRHEEKNQVEDLSKVIHYALLEAYFQYGVEGSTELKQRVLKMLGENDG